ncbi:Multidrug efflux pump subunit AcrB [Cohaesibacter sp. ES.047]|uniref:efflux RND transporter permease subunit n=1 Tax=Cohaesibacter sp. ES.047 TaxID=1798205 RepID=UPI000BB764AE|nr:efflux RND transporter permease subunit [Cohaesibacter sp. ES.047]SNY92576.1 Multidrug efflux pump subunit AcrB [Cohaesibacter sp. ES.047]
MSISRASIDNPILTWMLILGCLLGGLWGFMTMGRLEDPAFSIKTAVVITQYPGASAKDVAEEVSEPLESAIQQMSEIDYISSSNAPGLSRITVNIRMEFGPDQLPQIWDKLRHRVSDAAGELPDGAREPTVNDSFGDVYGIFMAVTAPGFAASELHDLAQYMRRNLLAVDGVASVTLDGLPEEVIYVEPRQAILNNIGLSPAAIIQALSIANPVTDTGTIHGEDKTTRLAAPVASSTVEEIGNLTIGASGKLISIHDFANVTRSETETPHRLIRFDGEEAFTIGIAGREDLNIVDIGHRVDDRINELMQNIPHGVQLHPIYQQHLVVEEASNSFLINLALSVSIVIIVLGLFMGWRAAIVVGSTLLLTVVGSLFFMAWFGIEMQRISLGALIIAMGMLVDNAIVVAEGMQSEMEQGNESRDAAQLVAAKTQIPLLGATVIGIMAFAGIGLSNDATGEFLFSLFAVIAISLLISWVLAVTVTPLLGHYLFQHGKDRDKDPYGGPVFRAYAKMLRGALRGRWFVVIGLILLTVACYVGFGQVKQQFFPPSNTPLFFVHYKLPQGSSIERTSADLEVLESWLAKQDEVVSTATFIGRGASRFMLTYKAEESLASYGHLIIRAKNLDAIPALRENLTEFAERALPDGLFRTERLTFGPGGGTPIQGRFSGPDPTVLRALAHEAENLMRKSSDRVENIRQNWYEQELTLRPDYAEDQALIAGITRADVSDTLKMATDGLTAGIYREEDRRIPIKIRTTDRNDKQAIHLLDQPIYSSAASRYVPISGVVKSLKPQTENTHIQRRDRVYNLTVLSGVAEDANASAVFEEVRPAIEAMDLPSGYNFEWGGEYETQTEAQQSLGLKLPITLIIMIVISIVLFGKLRQPLIIWLLVPMAVNGVSIGLLLSGIPFSFTALLGLLSLSGMLIKNGIVLVEEIDLVRAEGLALNEAIVRASTTRVRPVTLAAATTILGMLPLLWDAFFASMAVTIMGGLGFATVLTLLAAPVFYRLFFSKEA